MGRFWRCFLASFCLIRKVLCDGYTRREATEQSQRKSMEATQREESKTRREREIRVRVNEDAYHLGGGEEAAAAARGNPWIGGGEWRP
jgi:hypothetical protein